MWGMQNSKSRSSVLGFYKFWPLAINALYTENQLAYFARSIRIRRSVCVCANRNENWKWCATNLAPSRNGRTKAIATVHSIDGSIVRSFFSVVRSSERLCQFISKITNCYFQKLFSLDEQSEKRLSAANERRRTALPISNGTSTIQDSRQVSGLFERGNLMCAAQFFLVLLFYSLLQPLLLLW